MSIYKGLPLIRQFSINRKVIKEIRQLYGLNRGQLEILCGAYSLQEPDQPFFTVPALIQWLLVLPSTDVYKYIHQLEQIGYIEITRKTSSPSRANYYHITGPGELVLRRYARIMESHLNRV